MSGAILEMKNISKNFGSGIALKNVNLRNQGIDWRKRIRKINHIFNRSRYAKSNSWRNVFQRKILGANQYD